MNGKKITTEWSDRARYEGEIKLTLQKIEWLQNTIHDCIVMDRTRHHGIPTTTATLNDLALLEQLEEKLRLGRRITKSDMGLCNRILKRVKTHYRIDIDWRGDIESDHYTEYVLNKKRNVDADLYAQDTWKSNKMNLLYSWKEW